MNTARDYFDAGSTWTDDTARQALPLLLSLAKTGRRWTYGELSRVIEGRVDLPASKFTIRYNTVLTKIGTMLNLLSDEWQREVPPLTILIVSGTRDEPSKGVNDFLERYVTEERVGHLTTNNRKAMVDRATGAVHNFGDWDQVADYFGVTIPEATPLDRSDAQAIILPPPIPLRGAESPAHLALKQYVAHHPELFAKYGKFEPGALEFRLFSGDEVDVVFQNLEMTLVVEVKTGDAAPGELTRGLFQCVKYRAVLRAMYELLSEPMPVQAVLATPQQPRDESKRAAERLGVAWKRIVGSN